MQMISMQSKKKNKALFLDRDGVICKILDPNDGKGGYLIKAEEFELLPGIQKLIDNAREKGYVIIAVSNQPQIARGFLEEDGLAKIHLKMQSLLGNKIDKVYYCPHKNEDNCDCRKPKPGMFFKSQEDFDIDLADSIMVGDSDKDILAGRAAGCRTIFIKNEFKTQYLANCSPDYIVGSLEEIIPLLK